MNFKNVFSTLFSIHNWIKLQMILTWCYGLRDNFHGMATFKRLIIIEMIMEMIDSDPQNRWPESMTLKKWPWKNIFLIFNIFIIILILRAGCQTCVLNAPRRIQNLHHTKMDPDGKDKVSPNRVRTRNLRFRYRKEWFNRLNEIGINDLSLTSHAERYHFVMVDLAHVVLNTI